MRYPTGGRTIRLVLLAAGAGLLAYLLLRLGPTRIVAMLADLGWHFPPIVALYASYQAVRATALWLCVLPPHPLKWREALAIRLAGEAVHVLGFTGPVLGEPAKAWLLKSRGLTLGEGAAATLTEYLIYTFSSAALATAGLVYLHTVYDLNPALASAVRILVYANAAFLIVATVAIVRRYYLIGAIVGWVARRPLVDRRVRVDLEWVRRFEDQLLVILRDRPRRFSAVLGTELAAQALLVVEVYWVLRALGLPLTMAEPLLIEAATKFISLAFFFIPTQVGAAEASYAAIFDILGLGAAGGFVLALVRRARALVVAAAGLAAIARLTGQRAASGS